MRVRRSPGSADPQERAENGQPIASSMLVDTVVAVAFGVLEFTALFAAELLSGLWVFDSTGLVLFVGLVLSMLSLLVRRRCPWLTFAVMWMVALSAVFLQTGLNVVGIALALYALAVFRSRRSAWWACAGTTAGYVLIAAVSALPFVPDGVGVRTTTPVPLLVVLVATLIGVAVNGRRQVISGLVERAEQLERSRRQEARLVAAEERARIAREMHDIVAHGLSVMVSLADGADAIAVRDPARAQETMVRVGRYGRTTLAEMRRVLRVIGSEDDDEVLRPAPGVADIRALIDSYRHAGLPATLIELGSTRATESAQTTLYRIVQEALTNALRHSIAPTTVEVHLDHTVGEVVTVTDDGRGSRSVESLGSGRGLVGMRERVQLWGGTVVSGPRHDGTGWRVRATLPEAGVDCEDGTTGKTIELGEGSP